MNLEQIYREAGAYLEGHFLLSSGNHSQFYLQSAKVLENPELAGKLSDELASVIVKSGVEFDSVCSPALGGVLAGYELARAAKKRFIFTERVNKIMSLRRGFEVKKGERFIICEDIITTGGSALESARIIEELGGVVVGFAALANRGFCSLANINSDRKPECKLPFNKPLFALGNFEFEIYEPSDCPLCKNGSEAIKPGSRGN
ncbi:orotate phosphoribosyltransferase [Campylobacter sp. RM9344]|uniref:Orotate phosphoribosyltransferase n=1 Tax=Campylobacter californiensis TaxID=1032243 RepID=A0AAW3ZXR1_9BACT|nr:MULTISPECIES: orotate phosphoribosyltransferase [unclassified Campylobacter]MBE2985168.1 orotate phosphoribosyltransferase [Campylobacter sp. RM6883]MBE2987007.1 orotate phosphoribosyltransferase [Campylobacter sp. RM12919]MBE2988652.1 orotate phosphoribosyltransferase [Campylobacter sp. RM12920]MBE2995245.1 orotate phosphoribosyltransferase [Campylobacter sp. RM6913]MBE3022071.1 orotate phosphoribosyltransferase [Campylobacter sp. 7477a]MBE3029887.1 orotate phosphoribosyltransferase [Camp